MEIKGDTITVVPATHDPDGHKLDPECAPAARTISVSAPLQLSGGGTAGQIPGSFTYETTAGELAVGLRYKCAACKHFDVKRWRAYRRECEWSGDMDKRRWVNEIRLQIEQVMPADQREKYTDSQGDFDIEAAMDNMGLCMALTEEWSRRFNKTFPVLIHPLAGCPAVDPLGQPQSAPFQPKDSAADRAAAKVYDSVMGMAQGKMPEK
jgi:hypothetical protein